MYFLTFLLKNLLRRKVRTLLTVLGLMVAVGTVVTLRGVAEGFEQSFLENFQRRDIDLIVTASGVPDQLRSDLDQRIGPRIERMPGVRQVTSGLLELVDIRRGQSTLSSIVNGWRPGCPQFDELTILSGRALSSTDHHTAMLGVSLAEHLNKGVGDTIEMQGETFTVVGTYQSFTIFENGGAIVALDELQQLMARPGSVTGFTVVLGDVENKQALMESVRSQIESLKDDRGRPYRIAAQPTRQYVTGSIPIQLAHGMAWLTSGIALIIGAISMLNTMITSVMDRTKEIGILRAVGWRKLRVVRMVLGEALLLSLAGAALGVGVAVLAVRVLSRLPQTSGFISGDLAASVLVEGLLLTLLVTLIGGGYPALRAARLLPTEALRHE
jgi:putative ABC transport system permease protein